MRSAVLIPSTAKGRPTRPCCIFFQLGRPQDCRARLGYDRRALARPPKSDQRRSDERRGDNRREAATLGALTEIESSSRLRSRGGILYMSTPSAAGRPEGAQTT